MPLARAYFTHRPRARVLLSSAESEAPSITLDQPPDGTAKNCQKMVSSVLAVLDWTTPRASQTGASTSRRTWLDYVPSATGRFTSGHFDRLAARPAGSYP